MGVMIMKLASQLTNEYQSISQDESKTCMNSARLNKGRVEIETFYRYGKPVTRTVSKVEFYRLMNEGKV
jgi:hypothetical protein